MSYTEHIKDTIHNLLDTLPPLEERALIIESLNEEYFRETGGNLPPYLLELLGTWFLKEIYSDKSPNKTRLEEFPILSEYQEKRRDRRRVLIPQEEALDTLNFHLKNNSRFSKNKKYDGESRESKGED